MKNFRIVSILSLTVITFGLFPGKSFGRTLTFEKARLVSNWELLGNNSDFNAVIKGGKIIVKGNGTALVKTEQPQDVAFIKSLANLPPSYFLEAEIGNININKGVFVFAIYDDIFLGMNLADKGLEKSAKIGIQVSENRFFYIFYSDQNGNAHFWNGKRWEEDGEAVSVGLKSSKRKAYRLMISRDSEGYSCIIRDKAGKDLLKPAVVKFSKFAQDTVMLDYLGTGDLSEESNAGQFSIRRISLRSRKLDFMTQVPPVIDAKLNEVCWTRRSAAITTDFFRVDSALPATEKTKLYITSDREKLYIAWECWSKEIEKIKSKSRDRDGAVMQDDSVELFLRPNIHYQDNTYHLVVNSLGTIYDAVRRGANSSEDSKWNAEIEIKTVKRDDSWLVEMAMPLEAIGFKPFIAGSIWHLNAVRNDSINKEKSQWMGVLNDPEEYGELMGQEFHEVEIEAEKDKAVTLKIMRDSVYYNLMRKELKIALEIELKDGTVHKESRKLDAKGRNFDVTMDYILKGNERKIRALLMEPATDKVLGSDVWLSRH